MKIRDFLRENQLSVGDNVLLLLRKLGIENEELLRKLESEIGESAKMSKSKMNVVDPELAIERYGADTVRLYILFAAPPEQDFEWSEEGIQGAFRFINRLWNFVVSREEELRRVSYTREELSSLRGEAREFRRKVHTILKNYLEDVEERFQFNTAVAEIMKLFNEISSFSPSEEEDFKALREAVEILLLMLSPIAPHVAEELWHRIGKENLILTEGAPRVDERALVVEEVEIPVQINGRLRSRVRIPFGADRDTVLKIALSDRRVKSAVEGKEVRKVIYLPNRLINIVVA